MSTQTEINEALVQYLQTVGYREDKIISDPIHDHKYHFLIVKNLNIIW